MMQGHRCPKVASRDSARGDSADSRRRGSSFSGAAFLGPAGGQRGGDERHEQLVVSGDGVAVRSQSTPAGAWGGGTLHYILQRTVVLNKVEVRSGNRAERDAEIADDGNGFEENFGQEDGGAPIKIDAAGMHLLDKSAEEAEIVMRGSAKCSAAGSGMHVGNVRADGEMDRHGDAVFVSSHENAGISMFDFDDAAGEKLSGGFAVTDPNALGKFGKFVDVLAGFGGHAESPFADAGFDVFGSVAGQGDFKIVDHRRAVHGDSGDESAFHQIDQNGTEADFDDGPADPPEDGLALLGAALDSGESKTEIFGGEEVWK